MSSTVQFVGITAFHTQIADPLIGGTYMTVRLSSPLQLAMRDGRARSQLIRKLLNTISNLGGTWPKPLILRSVDVLTKATCSIGGEECISEHGKHVCEKLGGHCVVIRDGYYIMSAAGVLLSVGLLVGFILPTVKRLQGELQEWMMEGMLIYSSITDERVESQDPKLIGKISVCIYVSGCLLETNLNHCKLPV